MKKNIVIVALAPLLMSPVVVFAVLDFNNPPAANRIIDLAILFQSIVNIVWAGFFFIAVIMFICAGITFLIAQGEVGKIADARRFALWGTVGVGVALVGFSIVNIVAGIIGA